MSLEKEANSLFIYLKRMNNILIIEDSLEIGELLQELLTINNYNVEILTEPVKLPNYLKKSIPDLIICDVVMPSMSGYQVLQYLKEEHVHKKIPFIFLSAKVEEEDIAKGLSYGAEAYITKPYRSKILLGKVEELLERKKSFQAVDN